MKLSDRKTLKEVEAFVDDSEYCGQDIIDLWKKGKELAYLIGTVPIKIGEALEEAQQQHAEETTAAWWRGVRHGIETQRCGTAAICECCGKATPHPVSCCNECEKRIYRSDTETAPGHNPAVFAHKRGEGVFKPQAGTTTIHCEAGGAEVVVDAATRRWDTMDGIKKSPTPNFEDALRQFVQDNDIPKNVESLVFKVLAEEGMK